MTSNSPSTEISPNELKLLLDQQTDLFLLDCREKNEFEYCHLANANHLPMNEIPAKIESMLDLQAKRIVVICHHGVRSLRVTQFLRTRGFELAQSLSGGIEAWSQEIDRTMPRY